MTELETLAAALGRSAAGGGAVLATLVRVAGSAYRGPGARMLVLPDGTTVGAVSGGCLEKDLAEHAARVRAAGVPAHVAYDLTADDGAPWGLNLGCKAKLDVLLEPIAGATPPPWLEEVLETERAREPLVVAVVYRTPGGAAPGERLIVRSGRATSGAPAGPLGDALRVDAHRVLREERSDAVEYSLPDGTAGALVEYFAPPVAVVAFGDGDDAAAVVRLAEGLGWHGRCVRRDDAPGPLDERTAAVVMTHHYGRDRELIGTLLRSHARYVGALGPRSRTEQILAELGVEGNAPNAVQLLRLAAPAGLDIGAETPDEVALAILAEVRAVLSGRGGGRLRDRTGPIHDRR